MRNNVFLLNFKFQAFFSGETKVEKSWKFEINSVFSGFQEILERLMIFTTCYWIKYPHPRIKGPLETENPSEMIDLLWWRNNKSECKVASRAGFQEGTSVASRTSACLTVWKGWRRVRVATQLELNGYTFVCGSLEKMMVLRR